MTATTLSEPTTATADKRVDASDTTNSSLTDVTPSPGELCAAAALTSDVTSEMTSDITSDITSEMTPQDGGLLTATDDGDIKRRDEKKTK